MVERATIRMAASGSFDGVDRSRIALFSKDRSGLCTVLFELYIRFRAVL